MERSPHATTSHDHSCLLGALIVAFCLLIMCVIAASARAYGQPDLTWGGTGTVAYPGVSSARAQDVTVLPDGSVVAIGSTNPVKGTNPSYAGHPAVMLTKFKTDGSLDSSFGSGGYFVDPKYTAGGLLTVQSEAHYGAYDPVSGDVVVVAGWSEGSALILEGVDAQTGSLDPNFGGAGSGRVLLYGIRAVGLAITEDGRIVVATSSGSTTVVKEFDAEGNTVGWFSGGTVTCFTASSMAMTPDGKIWLAGNACGSPTGVAPTLVRLNADGSPDTSFNGTGERSYTATYSGDYFPGHAKIAVDDDGNLVVAGDDELNNYRVVERYLPDGDRDNTFGAGGVARFYPGATYTNAEVKDLFIYPDGHILTAGGVSGKFIISSQNPDGGLDSSFGTGGILTIPVAKSDGGALALAPYPGDRMIAAGVAGTVNDDLYLTGTSQAGVVSRFSGYRYLTDHDPRLFGAPKYGSATNGDPVTIATGNLVAHSTDFSVPSPGLAVSMDRYYNSQDAEDGPFGYGWTFPYKATATENAGSGDVTVREADGAQVHFDKQGTDYVAPPEVHETLTGNAVGGWDLTETDGAVESFDSSGRLSSITDRAGRQVTLTYASGKLSTITDPVGRDYTLTWTGSHVTSITFPGSTFSAPRSVSYGYTGDDLTSFVDAAGNETDYAYDADHQMTEWDRPGTAADPGGVTKYTYDDYGRVTAVNSTGGHEDTSYIYLPDAHTTYVKDASGNTTIYRYNGIGGITRIIDPQGHVQKFAYDAAGNRTSYVDQDGNETDYTYDALGDVTSITLPKVHPTDSTRPQSTFTYDAYGNQTSATDPEGNQTIDTYDPFTGLLVQTQAPDGGTTTYSDFNSLGEPRVVVDGRGNETDLTYDGHGNLTTKTAVDETGSPTWTYGYDHAGRQISTTPPLGAAHETTTTYTDDDQVASVTEPAPDPLGSPSTSYFTYDPRGNLLAKEDQNGHTTTYTYDPFDQLTSVTDPTGVTSTSTYDANGNLATQTDGAGNETVYNYDDEQRLSSVIYGYGSADATVTTYVYDPIGVVSEKVVDAGLGKRNEVTDYSYDGLGRLETLTQYAGLTPVSTEYSYDDDGKLTSVLDPDGNAIGFAYNSLGLLAGKATSVQAAASTAWSYVYDHNGNLTSSTSPNGVTTTRSYDALDQLTGVDYSDSTPDETFGYDADGNLVSQTDATGSSSYSYDDRDRMTEADLPGGNTIDYSWTPADQISQVAYPDGLSAGYGYDDAGRVDSVTDQASNVTSLSYDVGSGGNGNLASITYPGSGGSTSYGYDALNRVDELDNSSPGPTGLDSQMALAYDGASNLTSITDGGTTGISATFGYDDLNRLTSEDWTLPASTSTSRSYAYDAAGNRTSQTVGGVTTDYTFNDDESIATATSGGVETDYGYDNDGNLISQVTGSDATTYGYDGAGQLSSVDVPGGATGDQAYAYDASGHLASVTTGGSKTSDYLYDPLNGSASSGPVEGTDGAGTSGPSSFDLRAPGGDLLTRASQTSGALSGLAAVSPTAIHPDEMGSPLAETSTVDGSASSLTAYGAFGEPIYSSGSSALPYGYLDRLGLSGGLVNMNARPYDPSTGRFLQQDPLPGSAEAGQSWNPYAYGAGNPFVNPDITGLCFLDVACGAQDAVGGFVGDTATSVWGAGSSAVSSAGTWAWNAAGDAASYVGNAATSPCILSGPAFVGCYALMDNAVNSFGWNTIGNALTSVGEGLLNASATAVQWLGEHPAEINLAVSLTATGLCVATVFSCPLLAVGSFGAQTIVNLATAPNSSQFGKSELWAAGTSAFGAGSGIGLDTLVARAGGSAIPLSGRIGLEAPSLTVDSGDYLVHH